MKLGTIIALSIILVGCGLAGTQLMRMGSDAQLEEAKRRMSEAQKTARVERSYPAPMPPPKNTDVIIEPRPTIELKTDSVSKQLFNASLAFVVPDKANVDEEIKAQLLINPNKELEKLEKELTKKGTITSKQIKISRIVKATLTAPDFEVTKITDEEQIITENDSTEWLWTLSPKNSGKYDVNLSVTAIVNVNGKETKHHLKTFEKTITIEITPKQVLLNWLQKYWQWLISTLVIPLLIFVFKDRFKKFIGQ